MSANHNFLGLTDLRNRDTFAPDYTKSMQIRKQDISSRILAASRRLFLNKGYRGTSMREIAAVSGTSLANLYNYYDSKDSIFSEVTAPAVEHLMRMLTEHHGIKGTDVMDFCSEARYRATLDEYVALVDRYGDEFRILLHGAEGSAREGFKEEYISISTAQVRLWFNTMKERCPDINISVSDEFVRLNTVWMLSLMDELLRNDIVPERREVLMNDYVRFQILGWRAMLHV